jgi:hypothetical protein
MVKAIYSRSFHTWCHGLRSCICVDRRLDLSLLEGRKWITLIGQGWEHLGVQVQVQCFLRPGQDRVYIVPVRSHLCVKNSFNGFGTALCTVELMIRSGDSGMRCRTRDVCYHIEIICCRNSRRQGRQWRSVEHPLDLAQRSACRNIQKLTAESTLVNPSTRFTQHHATS